MADINRIRADVLVFYRELLFRDPLVSSTRNDYPANAVARTDEAGLTHWVNSFANLFDHGDPANGVPAGDYEKAKAEIFKAFRYSTEYVDVRRNVVDLYGLNMTAAMAAGDRYYRDGRTGGIFDLDNGHAFASWDEFTAHKNTTGGAVLTGTGLPTPALYAEYDRLHPAPGGGTGDDDDDTGNDDTPATDDDKIFGLPKLVVYLGAAGLAAAALFLGGGDSRR